MSSAVGASFIEVHEQALSEVDDAYHTFLLLYKARNNCVYGFCEGKDDPIFYQSLIESKLPNRWTVKLIPAGSKNKVIRAYHAFNWKRFDEERICFFIDRDLDDYLGPPRPLKSNVYITDGYSIENSVYECQMLLNVLSEIYQISLLSSVEEDIIAKIIKSNLDVFAAAMTPIMAQILLWRRSGVQANLNNLNLDHLFKFVDARVASDSREVLLQTAARHIGSALSPEGDIADAEQEISGCSDLCMLIRGKYIAWFMLRQCEALWKEIGSIIKRFTSRPKKRIEFGHKNAHVVFAPRARMPVSLCRFLDSNYIRYIRSREGPHIAPE